MDEKKVFLKQIKPVVSILKKSVSRKTALLDVARIDLTRTHFIFSLSRRPHKKSGWAFVGDYEAKIPLPSRFSFASEMRTDVIQCLAFTEKLIEAVK